MHDNNPIRFSLRFFIFIFLWRFWGPGPFPLDPGRISVQNGAILASIASTATLFVPEYLFWHDIMPGIYARRMAHWQPPLWQTLSGFTAMANFSIHLQLLDHRPHI